MAILAKSHDNYIPLVMKNLREFCRAMGEGMSGDWRCHGTDGTDRVKDMIRCVNKRNNVITL
jgi:hypothetical protein